MQQRSTFLFAEDMKKRYVHDTHGSPYCTDFRGVFERAERTTKEALRQRDIEFQRQRTGEQVDYGDRLRLDLDSERRHCHRDHFSLVNRDLRILAI
jgi:hypothetical protein